MNQINTKKFILGNFKVVINSIYSKIKKQKTTIILPCSLHDLAQKSDNEQDLKKSKKNDSYNSVDFFTSDSMWLTWWFRFKNDFNIERVYGPDLIISILEKTKKQKLSTVFLGANTKTISDLKKKTINKNQHQHYLILKKSDFSQEEQEVLNKIIKIQPNILWIGIGSPKQVELAAELKTKLKKTTIFCVGAAFDFITNNKSQAPKFIQKSGLEWLFRLFTEPKRLWKRYLIIIPKFMISIIIKKLLKPILPKKINKK